MSAFTRLLGMTVTGIRTPDQAAAAARLVEVGGEPETAEEMRGLGEQLEAVEERQAALRRLQEGIRVVKAQHAGRCGGCDEPIHEGDEIGVVDGEWVCEACVVDAGGEDNERRKNG